MPLRLYVIKPADETTRHPVVDRIAPRRVYLPETVGRCPPTTAPLAAPATSAVPARGPPGRPPPPARAGARAGAAIAQSVRARKGWRPRKIYVKELLAAVALADELDAAGDVGHLHAHFAHGTTTVTWLASMIIGRPFSFTGHAKDIYRVSLNPAGLLARKLRAARFVLTCTSANVEHLNAVARGAGVDRDVDIVLAYHGLNADFARLLADAPPAEPPERFRIVSVGRLVAKKGFDVLIEAVAQLRDRGLDAELVIAGEDGDAAPATRALIEQLGLASAVRFAGTVTQEKLLRLYRTSSVFALACRIDDSGDRDGIPNVLVEAMAAGMAVVSTSVSGIPEVVEDGDNGLLVPPEDPAALADALLRLAKDPRSRRARRAAARPDRRGVRRRPPGRALADRFRRSLA